MNAPKTITPIPFNDVNKARLPACYRLEPGQEEMAVGYIDSSYVRVLLKDGRTLPTRLVKATLGRTPENYDQVILGQPFLNNVFLTLNSAQRANYVGIPYRSLRFRYRGNRNNVLVTLLNPLVKQQCHVIELTMSNIDYCQYSQLRRWMENVFMFMVNNSNAIMNGTMSERQRDLMDFVLNNMDHSSRQKEIDTMESGKDLKIPPMLHELLVELQNFNVREDVPEVSATVDMYALLHLIKIHRALKGLSMSVRALLIHKLSKYKFKRTMLEYVTVIFKSRISFVEVHSLEALLNRDDKGTRQADIVNSLYLAYLIYDRKSKGDVSPVNIRKELLYELPTNTLYEKRILAALPIFNVVPKNKPIF